MSTAKCVGRVGALAVALGVGIAIAITPGAALAEPADSGMSSSPDRTALIMGGTTIPTPDDYMVQLFKNQIIAPTHPGEDIDYVALTTPQQWWPVTGFARLIGLVAGPPSVWGPGGAGWPDEPLWKLSGLFDLTIGQSLQAGVVDLETAMAAHGNDHLVVFGVSQGGICGRWSRVHAATHRDLADRYRAMATSLDFEGCNRGNSALANSCRRSSSIWRRLKTPVSGVLSFAPSRERNREIPARRSWYAPATVGRVRPPHSTFNTLSTMNC